MHDDFRTGPVDGGVAADRIGQVFVTSEQFRRRANAGEPHRQQIRMAAGHGDHIRGAGELVRVHGPAAVRRQVRAIFACHRHSLFAGRVSRQRCDTGGADGETFGLQAIDGHAEPLGEPCLAQGFRERTATGVASANEQHLATHPLFRLQFPFDTVQIAFVCLKAHCRRERLLQLSRRDAMTTVTAAELAELPTYIYYPESDGKPLGENTLQVKWIIALYNGFELLYRNDPNVFHAADLFWYPIEGEPRVVTAPDVMIAFGRPKGDRRCYKQWEEEDIPPQVVFEVLSPNNTNDEMDKKFRFYERYGAEEYYLYDPDRCILKIWVRQGKKLHPIAKADGFVSPRMGIRFEALKGQPMRLIAGDGQPFLTYMELRERYEREIERQQEQLLKTQAEAQRAQSLAQKLRELGIDPDTI